MNAETQQLIRQLATELGTTAEHLWSVLVQQAIVHGICSVVGIVILYSIAFFFHRLGGKKALTYEAESEKEPWLVLKTVSSVFAVIVTVGVVIKLPDICSCFFNPEYWALTKLLDQL